MQVNEETAHGQPILLDPPLVLTLQVETYIQVATTIISRRF